MHKNCVTLNKTEVGERYANCSQPALVASTTAYWVQTVSPRQHLSTQPGTGISLWQTLTCSRHQFKAKTEIVVNMCTDCTANSAVHRQW